MDEKRALGRRYVRDFVRVRPHVLTKVDGFHEERMSGRYTIGVHVRGTDFSYATPTPPEAYIRAVHEHVTESEVDDYAVFLATDQAQYVDLFAREFGSRLVVYDATRSQNDKAPFVLADSRPYALGEEVLIDVLLLSRCAFLIKGAAAVGEYALWFNEDLTCRDFALDSAFDTRKYFFLESAYWKLDVAGRGRVAASVILRLRATQREVSEWWWLTRQRIRRWARRMVGRVATLAKTARRTIAGRTGQR